MPSTRLVLALVAMAFCGCAEPVFAVAPVSGSPFPVGSGPQTVEFSPGGGLLAVANLFGSSVSVFSVDRGSGAVTAVTGSPFATEPEPFSVAFSPGGALLAVANFLNGGVSVFSVNQSTGALSLVSGSPPFTAGRSSSSVAFSPDARLLAVANGFSDDVSVYSVNESTGALSQVPGSPFATGKGPHSIAFSPDGGLLAVADFLSGNSVSVFSVSPSNGMLSQVSGSPLAVGSDPVSVAFSPDGGLLAVANSFSTNISVFSVRQNPEALSQVPGSPFTAGPAPWSVAFSPDGGLLAVANSDSNDMSVFSVNQRTGALSQVPGSPFATGRAPHSVVFSPDGGLLAVANSGSNNVSIFSNALSISIGAPADGGRYQRGQRVAARYSCQDRAGGPGIASCQGAVSNRSRIDTTTLGRHTFTVTATSKAGQRTSRTVTYTVVPTSRFTISRITTHADGAISLLVRVPGAGGVDVLVTARNDNLATLAALGQVKARRFVFARWHSHARGASRTRVRMKPTARGKRLIHHHTYRVTLKLSVTYTPSAGRSRAINVDGLHLPASR